VRQMGDGQMFLTAWRDLQFRRRRVAIAVFGTAMVFALSLVMTGIAASFDNEVRRSLAPFGSHWLRPEKANGALQAASPSEVTSAPTATQLGVARIDPVLFRNTSIGRGPKDKLAYFGVVRGGIGDPKPSVGSRLQRDGEIIIDKKFGKKVGDSLSLGGTEFKVVGLVSKRSILAGTPLSYMSIGDAQKVGFGGRNLASAYAMSGAPTKPVPGWITNTQSDLQEEMLQPLVEATKTIDLVRGLLWFVAALIVGSVMYLQALERTRDFAVLKATGSSSSSIAGGLALQAIFLTMIASLFALIIAILLAPLFPMNVEIPKSAFLTLPAVAVLTGLIAVLTGLRRSLSVEPAFAFRGA
jgi:putative ABC transport system permease protein